MATTVNDLPEQPPAGKGFGGLYLKLRAVGEAASVARQEIEKTAAAAKTATEDATKSIEDTVSAAIKGHKDLEQFAQSNLGGYLDTIVKTFEKLKDKNLSVQERFQTESGLRTLEDFLRRTVAPFFNLDTFRSLIERAITNVATGKSPASASAAKLLSIASGGARGILPAAPKPSSIDTLVSTGQIRG